MNMPYEIWFICKKYLEGSSYYKPDQDLEPEEIKEKNRKAMKLIKKFQKRNEGNFILCQHLQNLYNK